MCALTCAHACARRQGNCGDFIALGITKQSIVTLVGSWTLTVNTLMAKCILGEETSRLDYAAAGTIMGGIGLTVTASQSVPKEWDIMDLVDQV